MKRGLSRRFISEGFFLFAAILSFALLVMVNMIGARLDRMITFPSAECKLSSWAETMLDGVSGEISCTVILPRNNHVYPPLRQLLLNIKDEAENAAFTIDFLDPHSDPARSANAVRRYGLTNGWGIIFDNGRKVEKISYSSLLETTSRYSDKSVRPLSGTTRFRGEQICVTALSRLSSSKTPVIYALSGHGERNFKNYDSVSGYSDFAREILREGYIIKETNIENNGIPEDCNLLLVAGPRRAPTKNEETVISDYLKHGGRLLLFADWSESVPNGWEGVLADVGLKFANRTAIGANSLGGYNLLVDHFKDHPVTRDMDNCAIYFVNPQIFEPINDNGDSKVIVSTIVEAPENAWGEANPDVLPRRYDVDIDIKGHLPLIVVAETPRGDEQLGLNNTMRAVVIGDSNFAANSLINGGTTSNRDLLLNAISWLTDSGYASKAGIEADGGALSLTISRDRQLRFWVISVIIWPLLTAVFGLVMAGVRRITT